MADIRDSKNWGFETKQLHIGQEKADPVTDARAVPIYASTSYVFHNSQHAADRFGLRDAGNIYGRLTNPTEDVFEQRIASLEGGSAALAVASGAAAIDYTFQALAKTGEHIVASKTIYGGTYNLLAHTLPLTNGVTTTFVDPEVEGSFEAAIQENTKAIFVETLGNPNSNLVDLEEIAKIAHKHNIPLVVDSTFATPYLIRPFEYGADIVVHSSVDTEQQSVVSSLKEETSTGKQAENSHGSLIRTQVTTEFHLQTQLHRQLSLHTFVQLSYVIQEQHFLRFMHSYSFRD